MKAQLLFGFALLFSAFAGAATISGTAFEWYTLEPLPNVIVEIDTTPKQTDVAVGGYYSFSVIEPGTYHLRAEFFEDNRLKYEADENVSVKGDGDFTIDLIMLPALENDEFLYEEIGDIGVPENALENGNAPDSFSQLSLAILALVVFALLFFWAPKLIAKKGTGLEAERLGVGEKLARVEGTGKSGSVRNGGEKNNGNANAVSGKWGMAGKNADNAAEGGEARTEKDVAEVVGILGRYGGRMTQKELREKMPQYGEAKISLIVAELEAEGKIKKFRKGRGNVLVLK